MRTREQNRIAIILIYFAFIIILIVVNLVSNNSMKKILLTKSKYLVGLQCPKYIWIKIHEPERIPEFDISTKHKFAEG